VTRTNGHSSHGTGELIDHPETAEVLNDSSTSPLATDDSWPQFATRAKQRAKHPIQQNRFVIIAAGAVVAALLVFVGVSMPHRGGSPKTNKGPSVGRNEAIGDIGSEDQKSLFPITDSGRPAEKTARPSFLSERDLQRTAVHSAPNPPPTEPASRAGILSSIPPFGEKPQAPLDGGIGTGDLEIDKAERQVMERPSLVYVRKVSVAVGDHNLNQEDPTLGLGMATGTRLRAHLESTASTAVREPVLAVIEYSYENDGEIIVPAGAKAVGHIREANRSGYVDLEFDSLLMPDGTSFPIEAVAVGLDLRPLKGKVEGKNTKKNVLVRSLSGIGQVGSMLVGQGGLNQPLSESDLMRERVSSNLGEAGDAEISGLSVNQQIVVSVAAGMPVYIVLQQAQRSYQAHAPNTKSVSTASSENTEQLRELLQLQRELKQPSATNQTER
jgi:hypothetical protein